MEQITQRRLSIEEISPRPAHVGTPPDSGPSSGLQRRGMFANLKQKLAENRVGSNLAAAVTVLVGLALWRLPAGNGLIHFSFDIPAILGPKETPQEVVIVKMDEQSYTELKQVYPNWNRALHARLLDKLAADEARLVVFDVYFAQSDTRPEDGVLAEAIKANGRVVLAADYSTLAGMKGGTTHPPLDTFRDVAKGWGISLVEFDSDPAIRRHYTGTDDFSSLPWAAARALEAPVTQKPDARFRARWLRYYGDDGTLPSVSYDQALDKPPGFFKDKIVFIGGKPKTRFVREEIDEFHTPYTHFGGPFMGGVEVEATTFLNLLRDDWRTSLSDVIFFVLLLLCGVLFGCGLSLVRPLAGAGIMASAFIAITLLAVALFWYARLWFPWLVIAGAQLPCAWAWGVIMQTQKLQRRVQVLESGYATPAVGSPLLQASSPGGSPGAVTPRPVLPVTVTEPGTTRLAPNVADHTLLRCVGEGSYGQVWLAQNAIGLHHAVKIIYQSKFKDANPYEREFKGIQKYMPISLNHPGLVHILQVGRNDEAGYFYYVMELGDDETSGNKIDPQKYSPKNLAKELKQRSKLPVAECVEMSLALTAALDYLHQQRLIHRDIKPSNIIFVGGVPKFADIGLVTDIGGRGRDVTYIGTEGFIAPEGPGTAAADVYSLGKVLYEAAMGLDRQHFPELPDTLTERPDRAALMQLNDLIVKACMHDVRERYKSAAEMHADLKRLKERMDHTRVE